MSTRHPDDKLTFCIDIGGRFIAPAIEIETIVTGGGSG